MPNPEHADGPGTEVELYTGPRKETPSSEDGEHTEVADDSQPESERTFEREVSPRATAENKAKDPFYALNSEDFDTFRQMQHDLMERELRGIPENDKEGRAKARQKVIEQFPALRDEFLQGYLQLPKDAEKSYGTDATDNLYTLVDTYLKKVSIDQMSDEDWDVIDFDAEGKEVRCSGRQMVDLEHDERFGEYRDELRVREKQSADPGRKPRTSRVRGMGGFAPPDKGEVRADRQKERVSKGKIEDEFSDFDPLIQRLMREAAERAAQRAAKTPRKDRTTEPKEPQSAGTSRVRGMESPGSFKNPAEAPTNPAQKTEAQQRAEAVQLTEKTQEMQQTQFALGAARENLAAITARRLRLFGRKQYQADLEQAQQYYNSQLVRYGQMVDFMNAFNNGSTPRDANHLNDVRPPEQQNLFAIQFLLGEAGILNKSIMERQANSRTGKLNKWLRGMNFARNVVMGGRPAGVDSIVNAIGNVSDSGDRLRRAMETFTVQQETPRQTKIRRTIGGFAVGSPPRRWRYNGNDGKRVA